MQPYDDPVRCAEERSNVPPSHRWSQELRGDADGGVGQVHGRPFILHPLQLPDEYAIRAGFDTKVDRPQFAQGNPGGVQMGNRSPCASPDQWPWASFG